MPDIKIKGFAAMSAGATLTPITYETPPLNADEVRIDITHCGICGSDIQAIDDVYSAFDFPFVPGHEVVGHISEVGSAVPRSRLGERVGVGWQGRACGHCEWCRAGEVQLCMDVTSNGTWTPHGGFSSSIAVSDGFAYPLPEGLASEDAAVLMCAGLTVYTALARHYNPSANKIGILGIGGLGHLALQFAKAMGYEVTAISSSPKKLAEALVWGASQFVVSSDKQALGTFENYFDLLLITSHGPINWARLFETLKRRGKVILIAFPDIDFSPVDVVVHELSIIGSFVGRPEEMRQMLTFAEAHEIRPMIELMPMSQVNQAIEKMKSNKAHYRIVLVNDLN